MKISTLFVPALALSSLNAQASEKQDVLQIQQGLQHFCFETDADAVRVCHSLEMEKSVKALTNHMENEEFNLTFALEQIQSIRMGFNSHICKAPSWALQSLVFSKSYNMPMNLASDFLKAQNQPHTIVTDCEEEG